MRVLGKSFCLLVYLIHLLKFDAQYDLFHSGFLTLGADFEAAPTLRVKAPLVHVVKAPLMGQAALEYINLWILHYGGFYIPQIVSWGKETYGDELNFCL